VAGVAALADIPASAPAGMRATPRLTLAIPPLEFSACENKRLRV
jgi:hypothetical protein